MKHIRYAFLFFLTMSARPAFAVEDWMLHASDCVHLKTGGDIVYLANRCEKDVEVVFCANSPKSTYYCGEVGEPKGATTIKALSESGISSWAEDAGSVFHWVACDHPYYPHNYPNKINLYVPVYKCKSPLEEKNEKELSELDKKFDKLDQTDLADTLKRADECTAKRQYACSEQQLELAKKHTNTVEDKKRISSSLAKMAAERKREEEEKRLAEEKRRAAEAEYAKRLEAKARQQRQQQPSWDERCDSYWSWSRSGSSQSSFPSDMHQRCCENSCTYVRRHNPSGQFSAGAQCGSSNDARCGNY